MKNSIIGTLIAAGALAARCGGLVGAGGCHLVAAHLGLGADLDAARLAAHPQLVNLAAGVAVVIIAHNMAVY